MKRLTRRILIGSGLAFGSLGLAGGLSALACRRNNSATATLNPDRLRLARSSLIAPERIANAYRNGQSRAALIGEMAQKPGLCRAAGLDCPTAIQTELRRQVIEDFRNGDVVVADRFVVARSECIVAALIV
ncbi:hypothetical protein [Jannaschia sp. CCS1]|uniref:hypothetical protein n=1 Tax=Jannaschia sp. (strain CCS1) TaxID=290400 RepID=UPI000053DB6C|nr:hypothetical protein [Jannaschia sp. CCS1]ABD57183.1 hypothetical protein Jann_4267 [Jannaschia sp. CCS1]